MSELANSKLFEPLNTGVLRLSHRIVMAPLTRNRGTEPNLCPSQKHVEYYSQRASPGGLIITEATSISPEAVGYLSVPGIWTNEQVCAWRKVTESVHDKGGFIWLQLWHTGRVAHPSYADHEFLKQSGKPLPSVSSSSTRMVNPKTNKPLSCFTYQGRKKSGIPRALDIDEIPRLCRDYQHAAKNAIRAGFDGVEVHSAHGYLLDQFIQNGVNQRTDRYGGSIENRCRLLFEVVGSVCQVVGSGRVSVRLSPTTMVNGRQNQYWFGASTSDPDEVYAHAVAGLNRFNLAYLLLTEPRWNSRYSDDVKADPGYSQPLTNAKYRDIYNGTLMACGGFTPSTAADAVRKGHYNLIAFGRWFLANPDLPERIRVGAPLNEYNRKTFYTPTCFGGGDEGYTDYPDLTGSCGVVGKYPLINQNEIKVSLSNRAKL